MKRLISVLLSFSLIILSPGLDAARAVAQVVPIRANTPLNASGGSGSSISRSNAGGSSGISLKVSGITLKGNIAPMARPVVAGQTVVSSELSLINPSISDSVDPLTQTPAALAPVDAPDAPILSPNIAAEPVSALETPDEPGTSPASRPGRIRAHFRAIKNFFSTKSREEVAAPGASPTETITPAQTLKPSAPSSAETPQTPPAPQTPENKGGGWFGIGKMASFFIGSLLVAQIGVEALGPAMKKLSEDTFKDVGILADFAIFGAIAGIFGRAVGSVMVKKWGLKKTYIRPTILRMISIGVMAGLLATGHMTIPIMIGINAFNGFLAGIALTAESSIPPALVGQNPQKLERFWTLEQTLLEIVGVVAPIFIGAAVDSWGALPALIAFPVTFGISLLIAGLTLKLPQKLEALKKLDEKDPAEKSGLGSIFSGLFKRIGHGAKIVWRDPLLRTTFMAFAAFMMLNPFLYSIIAPAFSDRLVAAGAGSADVATGIYGLLTGLYSLGGLLGGFIMMAEQKLIKNAQERGTKKAALLNNPDGKMGKAWSWIKRLLARMRQSWPVDGLITGFSSLWRGFKELTVIKTISQLFNMDHIIPDTGGKPLTDAQANEVLRRSMLRWMKWGTFGLAAMATLALPIPALGTLVALPAWLSWAGALTLPALALIPFGIAQVITVVKLRSYFQAKAPAQDMADAMGFMGAAATAVSTIGLISLRFLFTGKVPLVHGPVFASFTGLAGFAPFILFAAAMIPLGFYYLRVTRKLDALSAAAAEKDGPSAPPTPGH